MLFYCKMQPREKYTECKVAYTKISGRVKKVLKYVNNRTKTTKILTVGKRGGLSYKSPNSKTRRYMRSTCKKTNVSKTFWDTVAQMHKVKSKTTLKKMKGGQGGQTIGNYNLNNPFLTSNHNPNNPFSAPSLKTLEPLANGPVRSPMNGSIRSPMNGSIRSPMNGSIRSPMNGSVRNPIYDSSKPAEVRVARLIDYN
jgi:hypothetical protein